VQAIVMPSSCADNLWDNWSADLKDLEIRAVESRGSWQNLQSILI